MRFAPPRPPLPMNAIRIFSPGLRKPAGRNTGTGAAEINGSCSEMHPGNAMPAAAIRPPPINSLRENSTFTILS